MNTSKQVILLDNKIPIAPYMDDLIDIYKLNKWGDGYNQSIMTKMYSSVIYRIAISNGKAIGALRAFSDNVIETHVIEVIIHPSFQKMGFGSILMNEIFKDYSSTIIYVSSLNESSDFFSKLGMKNKSSQLKSYVKKPDQR